MAVDFTRSASDNVSTSSNPVTNKPMMMECWFKLDGWGTLGTSYGTLMGIFEQLGLGYYARLHVQKVAGIPDVYTLEFTVNSSAGLTTGAHATALSTGTWYHALGYWSSTTNLVRVALDGSLAGASTNAGSMLGSYDYTLGYDNTNGASGDAFDGQMCEWVVWWQNNTSGVGEKAATSAYVGLPPTERYPFRTTNILQSWIRGHNNSDIDLIRPSVSYTWTGTSTVEDHAPVFDAPRPERWPQGAAVTTRRVSIGGLWPDSSRIMLAG